MSENNFQTCSNLCLAADLESPQELLVFLAVQGLAPLGLGQALMLPDSAQELGLLNLGQEPALPELVFPDWEKEPGTLPDSAQELLLAASLGHTESTDYPGPEFLIPENRRILQKKVPPLQKV